MKPRQGPLPGGFRTLLAARHPSAMCAVFAVAVSACGGQSPSSATDSSDRTLATHPGVDAETAHVQQYLDAAYPSSDIRHAYRSRLGDDMVCVDLAAQASPKSPLFRNQAVATPSSGTRTVFTPGAYPRNTLNPPDRYPAGLHRNAPGDRQLDENGQLRKCPEGTVAVVRPRAKDIVAAGGLNAWLAAAHNRHVPPPAAQPSSGWRLNSGPVFGQQVWQVYEGIPAADSVGDAYGNYVGGMFLVAAPTVYSRVDHSLGQTWTYLGGSAGYPCSASGNCFQTVEAGWIVYNALDGDYAPHIFVFSTRSGYDPNDCYNFGPMCPHSGFVPYSNFWDYAAGNTLNAGDEIFVETLNCTGDCWICSDGADDASSCTEFLNFDWWVFINSAPIGYYPASLFYADTNVAYAFAAGGEASTATQGPPMAGSAPDMGTGWYASLGNGFAAYVRQLRYGWSQPGVPFDWTPYPPLSAPQVDQPQCYQFNNDMPPGGLDWATYFYFGGSCP